RRPPWKVELTPPPKGPNVAEPPMAAEAKPFWMFWKDRGSLSRKLRSLTFLEDILGGHFGETLGLTWLNVQGLLLELGDTDFEYCVNAVSERVGRVACPVKTFD